MEINKQMNQWWDISAVAALQAFMSSAVSSVTLSAKLRYSPLPQIDHVVKGHVAYSQLQEQARQRSADAFSAALPKNVKALLSSLFSWRIIMLSKLWKD